MSAMVHPVPRFAALAAAIILATGCAEPAPTAPRTTAHPLSMPPSTAPGSDEIQPSGVTPGTSPSDTTSATPTVTPSPQPVAAHWEKTGKLRHPRDGSSLVLLGDGRVLSVGGSAADVDAYATASDDSMLVEIWNPATGKWRDAAPLNKPRTGFAGMTLLDGRVLVAGGLNAGGTSYSSAYVFDPETDRWEKVGLLNAARSYPGAAVLKDGRVLVAGGEYSGGPEAGTGGWAGATLAAYRRVGGSGPGETRPIPADLDPGPSGRPLATAELFDPQTGTWSKTGSMRYARVGPPTVTLGSGRVLVWGGMDANSDGPERGEIYDPETGRFSPAPELPPVERSSLERLGAPVPPEPSSFPGGSEALVGLPDGSALISQYWSWYPLNGNALFRLDPDGDTWTLVDLPFAEDERGRTWGEPYPNGMDVALADGRVMFAGGDRGRDMMALDPGTGRWSKLPRLPAALADTWDATWERLSDGSVLVVGGSGLPVAYRFVPGQ